MIKKELSFTHTDSENGVELEVIYSEHSRNEEYYGRPQILKVDLYDDVSGLNQIVLSTKAARELLEFLSETARTMHW